MVVELSDGVIFLRPLCREDDTDFRAGEDDAIAERLSGGRSTPVPVQSYITSCQEHWHVQGPRRAFGTVDAASKTLIGSIEANLALAAGAGQVNISFGVFPDWRGRGMLTVLRTLRMILRLSGYCDCIL
jgi:hypothetical protein